MKRTNQRNRHEVSGTPPVKRHHISTGEKIRRVYAKKSGELPPIAGDSLIELERRLAAL